jgi:outer membrane receptor protein involved in Fe transport
VRSANAQFIDAYSITNVRAGIINERYEVAVWARNLFDEDYLTAVSFQPRFNQGAITDTTQGFGATFGLTARVNFGN